MCCGYKFKAKIANRFKKQLFFFGGGVHFPVIWNLKLVPLDCVQGIFDFNFIEFVACTVLIKKKRRKGKKNNSNWSRKQEDVPIDIQPQQILTK